jgi:hypothetical protein
MEILKIKNEHESELLKIAGVTGVGILGNTSAAIIIYVEKLTPQLVSILPKNIEGIPTKIIKTGKIIPLGLSFMPAPAAATYQARTSRVRPCPGGVSMGSPNITAGTLTCRAIDKNTGAILGLTNNHVGGPIWGTEQTAVVGETPEYQPGVYDGGGSADTIGILDGIIPVVLDADNLVDICRFSTGEVISTIEELGVPDAVMDPYVGQNVVKSGRTSGVTYGSIIDVNATITVSGWGDVIFKDQITMGKMLDPGDSGSCILESDTLKIVGVGHAGSPDMSVACKAKNVESLLNVQMISPAVALPLPTGSSLFVTGAFASAFLVGQNLLKPRGVEEGIVI